MARSPVQIHTTAGVVEGFTRGGLHRFRGIPYAEPPVGPLRLRAPRPVRPWTGVRPARRWGYAPYQPKVYIPNHRRSEDCLTLNVVTPTGAAESGERLPVIFYIYGGGYFLGATSSPPYEGGSLARRGCVYVSANYRLGPLGTFDLSSLSTPGAAIDDNLFLRDLVLALEWVRDNIGAFGGDPDNVTVGGVSAGASATETLLATPAATGLFHRAICQSTANGLAESAEIVAPAAQRFAELLGAGPTDAAQAVLAATPRHLGRALRRILAEGFFPLGPSVGGEYLPQRPIEAIESGVAQRIPLMLGYNRDEAKLFRYIVKVLPLTERAIEPFLAEGGEQLRDRVVAAYPGYPATRARFKLAGDMVFSSAAWRIAEGHQRYAPTYLYRYDYAPWPLRAVRLGPTHGTELMAMFGSYRSPAGVALAGSIPRRYAIDVSDDMQQRWVAFARTGIPGDGWPRYRPPDRATMVFDHPSHVERDPDGQRRPVWAGFRFDMR